jgi:hypothetical protein
MIQIFMIACDGDHGSIIGTVFKRRDVTVPALLCAKFLEPFPEPAIGRHTSRQAQLRDAGMEGCFLQLVEQDGDDAFLYRSTDVRKVLLNEIRILLCLQL